jgi:hypothetical protein
MRQRWILAAVVVLCAFSSSLLARPGTVITKDNTAYDGDVTEDKTAGTVTILMHGIPYSLKLANIQSITYVDQVDADVRGKLLELPPTDVKGRLALAQYALHHHATTAARDVLVDAQRIDPADADVRDLLEQVKAQLRAEAPATQSSGPVAASQPTTQPVGGGVFGGIAIAPPAPTGGVTREVTPDEINFIRQSELRDGDNVRVRIDVELRKRFADYINMSPADFNKLPAMAQAFMILDKGKPDMRRQVKILGDPPAIISFRKTVDRTLLVGCATSKCHGGSKPAIFRLYPQDNEAAAYTNFLVLQQYSARLQGRQILMIDRQSPEQSLLLSYMLPPAITDLPHPEAKGYHGALRNRTDPRFAQALAWIRDDLKPLTPDYSAIDLSQPPTTRPAETAGAAPANP